MKIGLVVPGGVDPSGQERVIPALLWLTERLSGAHSVRVVATRQPGTPPSYELRGAEVISLARKRGDRPWPAALPRLLRALGEPPVDVIHAFWAAPEGTLAVIAGALLRKPTVVHLAGGELVALPEIGYGGGLRWQSRLWATIALRCAVRVTAASRPMIEAAAVRGVPAERVPLGVALDRWPERDPRPRRPGEQAHLLHVGSLNAVKDQARLLEAAALLSYRGVDFQLDVVGEDTLGGALQSRARMLGVADCVRFHGFVPHPELRSLAERADLFVLSSQHEAGPVAVLEAAVIGIPTVGTDVGHIRELAPDAAVAVPVGDPQALARGVESLLVDENRRLSLAREARRRALEWDADRTAGRFVEIYREIQSLEGSAARARQ